MDRFRGRENVGVRVDRTSSTFLHPINFDVNRIDPWMLITCRFLELWLEESLMNSGTGVSKRKNSEELLFGQLRV